MNRKTKYEILKRLCAMVYIALQIVLMTRYGGIIDTTNSDMLRGVIMAAYLLCMCFLALLFCIALGDIDELLNGKSPRSPECIPVGSLKFYLIANPVGLIPWMLMLVQTTPTGSDKS